MKRLIFVIPVLLFAVLAFFLFKSLIAPPPQELPSVLVNKPVPQVSLPPLDDTTKGFGPADFKAGHVTILNVFASWCVPCRAEAPLLPLLKRVKGVKLYGMVYKDTPSQAEEFLRENGNAFDRIGLDESGSAGIEWGVYGVPETFVVDGKGTILLRHAGPLTKAVIDDQIAPVVAKAKAEG